MRNIFKQGVIIFIGAVLMSGVMLTGCAGNSDSLPSVSAGTPGVADQDNEGQGSSESEGNQQGQEDAPEAEAAEDKIETNNENTVDDAPDTKETDTGDPVEDSGIEDAIPLAHTGDENETANAIGTDETEAGSSNVDTDETEAGNGALSADIRDPYPSEYQRASTATEADQLSNESAGWYYNRNNEHQPPSAQRVFDIREYDAHYLGDISQQRIYLTFDEGYENGFTEPILDILKEKNVHATFFLTKTYIRDNPELSKRFAEEGHVVGNHSARHISFPTLTDEELKEELEETARYYEEITGYQMDLFVRPPSGEYSERTLFLTQACGYTTVFWSFAHEDWLVDKQPGKEVTFNRVMDNLHNGAVILLHAVSQSNTEALPDLIDTIRAQGYTFGSLYELVE